MSQTITCPSGLSGVMRGMKVREERVFADRKLARRGGQLDALLGACWEQTLDPGPYAFGTEEIDWGAVLQGDRFYALLQLRALTYGAEYAFAVGCQEASCRARFEWEIDLNALKVRRLSAESLAAFSGGNRFEATLPDAGVRLWFQLFTGADERKLPQLRRSAGERMLSAMLAQRVVEVEGVSPQEKRAFLEELSLRDADYLVDEFDRVECGVDTTIEVECPECFTVQEVELPFDQGFFLPGRARSTRRRVRSSSSSALSSSSGARGSSSSAGGSTAARGST